MSNNRWSHIDCIISISKLRLVKLVRENGKRIFVNKPNLSLNWFGTNIDMSIFLLHRIPFRKRITSSLIFKSTWNIVKNLSNKILPKNCYLLLKNVGNKLTSCSSVVVFSRLLVNVYKQDCTSKPEKCSICLDI